MTQAAERDQRAEGARAFIAGRLGRHRGPVVAVVCAALLNAGLVAAVVSWVAGCTKAGLVAARTVKRARSRQPFASQRPLPTRLVSKRW